MSRCGDDAGRFLGATFDPSGLYRFNAAARMLAEEGLTTARVSEHVAVLQANLLGRIGECGRLSEAELLNAAGGRGAGTGLPGPVGDGRRARAIDEAAADEGSAGTVLHRV